jgi:hypothetical protein
LPSIKVLIKYHNWWWRGKTYSFNEKIQISTFN